MRKMRHRAAYRRVFVCSLLSLIICFGSEGLLTAWADSQAPGTTPPGDTPRDALVLSLLTASSAPGRLLYLCPMDEQASWSCCCEDLNETSTQSAHQAAACCCDIVRFESEPLHVNASAWASTTYTPILVALPTFLAQTDFREDSAAQFLSPQPPLFPSTLPIFLQNCSYLI